MPMLREDWLSWARLPDNMLRDGALDLMEFSDAELRRLAVLERRYAKIYAEEMMKENSFPVENIQHYQGE